MDNRREFGMSSYKELIKNFEKIRAYMREFYVYGFKSRSDYDKKSSRTYDDERRRMESWLGAHMRFVRTREGKNMFISIDSRVLAHNPLYKTWKAKSFTDGDITLHFILFDILNSPGVALSLPEIMQKMDCEYLSAFREPMLFDESTVRKKLKEYIAEGIIVCEKQGRGILYRRAETFDVSDSADVLHFYSEIAPCGVIGSFLLDKYKKNTKNFGFKHHYITSALDSDVLAVLFDAMRKKCEITATNLSNRSLVSKEIRVIPLRIFISAQNGRQHLLAYVPSRKQIHSFRVDYMSNIQIGEICSAFDAYRELLDKRMEHMWGINCGAYDAVLEHVEFTVRVHCDETHIVQRLLREKRVGQVELVDENRYRFCADVYDSNELVPWIRTFICRITDLNFSNKAVEKRFREDMKAMYRLYGLNGGALL